MESGHEEPSDNIDPKKPKRGFFKRVVGDPEHSHRNLQETANTIADLLTKQNRFMTLAEITVEANISPADAFITLPVMYANKWLLKKYSSGDKALIIGYDEVTHTEQGLLAQTPILDKMLSEAGIVMNQNYIEVINGISDIEISYGIPRDNDPDPDFRMMPLEPIVDESNP